MDKYISCREATIYAPLPKHLREYQTANLDDAWEDGYDYALSQVKATHAANVRPVVLCKDCINYVESEEVNGEKMCVRDADWCVDDGCYYGFTEYPSPDWFCADGKKREGS